MAGVTPSAQDIEILVKWSLLQREISPGLLQLDYPTPLSPEEAKRKKEAAATLEKLSAKRRRNIVAFLQKVEEKAQESAEADEALKKNDPVS